MRYPHGNCRDCGERLYAHVDGGYACHNCQRRYPPGQFEGLTA